MGGGGMGPISVTPIGGSGRSVRWSAPTADVAAASAGDGAAAAAAALDDSDRPPFDPTVTVVVAPEVELVVIVDDTMVTEMVGKTAVRPASFDMIDGGADHNKKERETEIYIYIGFSLSINGKLQKKKLQKKGTKMKTIC